MNIFHTDVLAFTTELFRLERCGRYEEAFAELRQIWDDTSKFPVVDESSPRLAAEVFLRCGALLGFLGHNKQIPDSQENSRNILTEARRRFLQFYDLEKIAECENYLALAYWRTGEIVEADTWIEESISHNLPTSSKIRLHSSIIKCLIAIPSKRYRDTIEILSVLEDDFLNYGDDCLKGDLYSHLGLAYKYINQIPEALEKLELARSFHEKAGHLIYLGIDLNNLSQLYKKERRFEDAHRTIDEATSLFSRIKDRTREGFSLDTKAQIFFDERQYAKGLTAAEKAIKILSNCDNAAYVVETYLTKAQLLLHLDELTEAFLCLSDAVQLAKAKISEERARNLISEFEDIRRKKEEQLYNSTVTEKSIHNESVELVLHPSIAHYDDFHGVWIKNSHLEKFGLKKGSLAVVTKQDLRRGDLVAINDLSTQTVVCGFYDAEFGLICLEGIGDDPVFFDENEIEILGKVIGFGIPGNADNGKLQIQPIKI